jgi:hypothetical protein
VDRLEQRVTYGRDIRKRAIVLLEAHGESAFEAAASASREPGLSDAERAFWEAVASRIARELGRHDLVPAA